jgi:hypothetical protein
MNGHPVASDVNGASAAQQLRLCEERPFHQDGREATRSHVGRHSRHRHHDPKSRGPSKQISRMTAAEHPVHDLVGQLGVASRR